MNVHVEWPQLAAILGIPSRSRALPVTTTCPLCGGRLSIYQDNKCQGAWHYCFGCHSAGELTELAAAVWQVPLTDAIRRLAIEGVGIPHECLTEERLAAQLENYWAQRQTVVQMWNKAQKGLLDHNDIRVNKLLQRHGLHAYYSRERLFEGPAKLYGVLHDKEIAKAVCSAASVKNKETAFSRPDMSIVIPYQITPGHIGAFTFVRSSGEQVHLTVPHRQYGEAGLAGLDMALECNSSTVLATDNVLAMLRLQVRHFHSAMIPLAMVAWYPYHYNPTRVAWAALENRQIVVWARRMTAEVIEQCQRTDARLIVRGPQHNTNSGWMEYFCEYKPADFFKQLVQTAKPWREAVKNWLGHDNDQEIVQVIQELNKRPGGLEILKECAPSHPRLAGSRRQPILATKYKGVEYVEQGGRWFKRNLRHDVLVFPGTLIVDQIVRYKQSTRATGRVLIDGQEHAFQTPLPPRPASQQLQNLIASFSLEQGTTYSSKLLALAMQFREPKIRRGIAQVGWVKNRYQFRNLTLRQGRATWHDDDRWFGKNLGPQLARFRCDKHVMDALSRDDATTSQLWSLMLAALLPVCAPPKGGVGQGVITTGAAIKIASVHWALALGFRDLREGRGVTLQPQKYRSRAWPCYYESSQPRNRGESWIWIATSAMNRLVHLGAPLWAYCLPEYNLPVVRWSQLVTAQAIANFPIEHAFMGFLRYYSGHPRLHQPVPCLWTEIQQLAAEWLESYDRPSATVRRAHQHVVLPGDPTIPARLAAQLYARQVFTIDGKGPRSVPEPLQLRDGNFVATAAMFATACQALQLPAPPLLGEIVIPRSIVQEELALCDTGR